MKKMKKLLSMLLAVVMVLAMAAPSFAAEGDSDTSQGRITVDNPVKKGESDNFYNYTAYKIFDVKYNEDKTAYAYSIDKNSPWYNYVREYADSYSTELTLTPSAANPDNFAVNFPGNATNKPNLNAAQFASFLKNKSVPTNAVPNVLQVTEDGTKLYVDVELGYYFVTSDRTETNALCNLTTTDPNVTIYDKNDVPFEKTDNQSTVEVGEDVNYVITGKLPDATGFTKYVYTIRDTMDSGLKFKKDVKVYLGYKENEITNDTPELGQEYYLLTNNETGFELTIKVKELQNTEEKRAQNVAKPIIVKYSATITDDAVSVISENNASLEYSNNPEEENSTDIKTDKENVYSAKITIDKYAKQADENDKSHKLAGAKFVLKNNEGKFYRHIDKKDATDDSPEVLADVEWVDNLDDATDVTTDNNGYAEFLGLKDGTYNLVEIEAPSGYNLLDTELTIIVDGSEILTKVTATTTDSEKAAFYEEYLVDGEAVANSAGMQLPSTGGIGTTIFYAVGIILMAGAVFFVVRRKKA